jgi:hypothetical protein
MNIFLEKRIYLNRFTLIGTGLGTATFGQFSYLYLNSDKFAPHKGYYTGNLQYIVEYVPELIRYLSLCCLIVGLLGVLFLLPGILHNKK